MNTESRKPLHPLMWAAGIAIVVVCGAGAAALMGWIPGSAGKPADASLDGKLAKSPAAQKARAPAKIAVCSECGVIQSVQEIDTKGKGSGVGAVGGAVVGGVVGNQVGHGDTRKIATVVGAVGGAVVGNEIEKHVRSTKSWEITVRFDDGSTRVLTEDVATSWRAGDKVKVVNGVIQAP
jgi:outer membrane lipoprotein SlyB